MYAIYADQLTPQITPTDRHLFHTWSVWDRKLPSFELFPYTWISTLARTRALFLVELRRLGPGDANTSRSKPRGGVPPELELKRGGAP